MKKCVFCQSGSDVVKITKEHVLPVWLGEALNTGEINHALESWHLNRAGNRIMDFDGVRPVGPYEMVVNRVCKVCNNEWMNQLVEVPVMSLLPQLSSGEISELSANELKSLATWACKTVFIRSLMDRGQQMIPKWKFDRLRTSIQPPEYTWIWLLKSSESNTYTRHYRFKLTNPDVGGHISYVIIPGLAFMVVGLSRSQEMIPQHQLEHTMSESLGESSALIWPMSAGGIKLNGEAFTLDAINQAVERIDGVMKLCSVFPPLKRVNKHGLRDPR
jgi:hypothetical protein